MKIFDNILFIMFVGKLLMEEISYGAKIESVGLLRRALDIKTTNLGNNYMYIIQSKFLVPDVMSTGKSVTICLLAVASFQCIKVFLMIIDCLYYIV